MIDAVIISVFSIFLVTLFDYGKLFGELKVFVAPYLTKNYESSEQYKKALKDLKNMPYNDAYELSEKVYDLIGGQSKIMRLLNCYLCFSSWFVIVFTSILGGDLITALAVNYVMNRLNESI